MNYETQWSADDDAMLRRLRGEDRSFGQIVEGRFFPGRSRNAIIGRAGRLGLSEKRGPRALSGLLPKAKHSVAKAPRTPKAPRLPQPTPATRRSVLDELAVYPVMELPPDSSEFAINFFEATAGDNKCRFPIGEPSNLYEFRFCGDQAYEGQPYCIRHFLLTHKRASDGKNDRPDRESLRSADGQKLFRAQRS